MINALCILILLLSAQYSQMPYVTKPSQPARSKPHEKRLQVRNLMRTEVYPIKLGDETVLIKKQQVKKTGGKAFVHLHQNERTALNAAVSVVKSQGGSVLTLIHRGGRNIIFHLNHRRYEFDPNRIFTEQGIKKSLSQYGAYSAQAHVKVRQLAAKIKTLIPKGKIIAVHNNQSYSMRDYYPGRALASDARALHVSKTHSYRNFYLMTQRKDYLRLKKLKYNSILQVPHPKDDGSLSVYLSAQPYVNVEAGHDQLDVQINMLRTV